MDEIDVFIIDFFGGVSKIKDFSDF